MARRPMRSKVSTRRTAFVRKVLVGFDPRCFQRRTGSSRFRNYLRVDHALLCPDLKFGEKSNRCECSAFCFRKLENKFCLQRFLAKPANLRQVATSEVFRNLIGQLNSWKMAANRDEHRLEPLLKANQAIVRINIAWLRVSSDVRIVHLKGHKLDGLLACHRCISLLLAVCSKKEKLKLASMCIVMHLDLRQLDFGALFPGVT